MKNMQYNCMHLQIKVTAIKLETAQETLLFLNSNLKNQFLIQQNSMLQAE